MARHHNFLLLPLLQLLLLLLWASCAEERVDHGSNIERETRESMARHYFEYATEAIGAVGDAIPHLRAAVRLDPKVSEYQARLAWAEVNSGVSGSSEVVAILRRILQAIRLDPGNLLAIKYLKENKEAIKIALVNDVVSRNRNYYQKFVRVESLPESPTMQFDKPFFMKNSVKDLLHWLHGYNDNNEGVNFDALQFFKSSYPSVNVETYPHNNNIKPPHKYFRNYKQTLSDVADFIKFPDTAYAKVDASLAGTYAHWNTGFANFTEILGQLNATMDFETAFNVGIGKTIFNECLADSPSLSLEFSTKLHWFMVLFSEKAGGMFFHKDEISLSSWQAQIQGGKAWLICPPVDLQVESIIDRLRKEDMFISAADGDNTLEIESLTRKLTLFVESLYEIIDFYSVCPLCSEVDFDLKSAFNDYNISINQLFGGQKIDFGVDTEGTVDRIGGEYIDSGNSNGEKTKEEDEGDVDGFKSDNDAFKNEDKIAVIQSHFMSLPPVVRRMLLVQPIDLPNTNAGGLVTCHTAAVPAMSLIFYPRGYYHQTYNLDTPSVAISNSILRADDMKYFLSQIIEECKDHIESSSSFESFKAANSVSESLYKNSRAKYSKKYNFSPELCRRLLDVCFTDYLSKPSIK